MEDGEEDCYIRQKQRVSKRYHRNQSSPHDNKGKQRVLTMTRSQPPHTPYTSTQINTQPQNRHLKCPLIYAHRNIHMKWPQKVLKVFKKRPYTGRTTTKWKLEKTLTIIDKKLN